MKIGYIISSTFPHWWVDTQQVVKSANALAKNGHEVDLIIPRKWDRYFFSSNQKRKEVLSKFYGVDIHFNLVQIPQIPPSQLRLEKFSHGILGPLVAFFGQYDAIYTRNVWVLDVAIALGIPSFFENHRLIKDQYPVYYKMFSLVKKSKKLKGVVTNAQIIANHYIDLNIDPKRVLVAHNAFDPNDTLPVMSKESARKKLGMQPTKKIICYSGNIRMFKGMDFIIQMAAKLPDFDFMICGGFEDDVNQAKKYAQQLGANNMQFYGWVPVHALSTYLYASDFLLIPPTAKPFQKHKNTVLPIKTYTYMSAGRVIIAPDMADTREVLINEKNAILVEPDCLDKTIKKIREVAQDNKLCERLSTQAAIDSLKYTWDQRAKSISSFLNQCFID